MEKLQINTHLLQFVTDLHMLLRYCPRQKKQTAGHNQQKNKAEQVNGIDHEIINIPKIRQIIAKKLTLSKSSIPHFYLRRKANVDELINFRNKTNDLLEKSNKI